MYKTQSDWYIIINPRAGSGKTMSEWLPAEKLLDKYGIAYTAAYTDHKAHATQLAYDAAGAGFRRILAVGGDGSLHEAFAGICKWCAENGVNTDEFTLGVAPIGSGNDWIKSLDVPRDTKAVVELIRRNSFGSMDVAKVDFGDGTDYMANIGGVGFDSHVCVRVNFQKQRGFRSRRIYINALLHTILHIGAINVRIKGDGETFFEGPCYSIALGNGRFSGSGMRQVPLAEIDDQILDVMVVPKIGLLTIARELPRLMNGKLYKSKPVRMGRFRTITIEPLDEASRDVFELDGEVVGRLPLTVSVDGSVINVIKGR